jgi:hypothetical protein
MPTEAQRRLAEFYGEIVRRAPHACRHWAVDEPGYAVNDGGVTLVPGGQWVAPEWIELWPTLPLASGDQPEPAFVLDRYAVEQAFTRILKLDSEFRSGTGQLQVSLRDLHLAELQANAALLSDLHLDFVVQVAVFGRAVFRR